MALNMTFWIVAWVMMAVAFLMAACAIIFGAKALDRLPESGTSDQDAVGIADSPNAKP